ncbi:MAG: patatin family protein [Erysipelotrichaceae bacterium]|nr:patatin family protein [Erysipelotrichaceae bacterium]
MRSDIGLICEGGGTKAAYTSGVLQCFLDQNIIFPYCVGISAGAENLLPYVSRQKERLRVTGVDSASQKGAVGLLPLIREKGLFGIESTFRYIEDHAPLDYETFAKSETKLDIGVYNLHTNKIEYFDKSYYTKEDQSLVKAACALLILARPHKFQNKMYMDAGLIDMIAIEQSIKRGNKKHVFISTKEENYKRKPAPTWHIHLARLLYPKNKKIQEHLKERHHRYQEQWEMIKKLEKEGKALVLRPSADYGVSRYTRDKEKLQAWFDLGYKDTMKRLDMIKKFVEE